MSRSLFHGLQNHIGQALTSVDTNLSGAATLAAPAAGHHLRVYRVILQAPILMVLPQTIFLLDGPSGVVRQTFVLPTLSIRDVDLGAHFLRFDTSVAFTGAAENVRVTFYYDQKRT